MQKRSNSNKFWYNHTYQAFIRRIKGLESIKDQLSNEDYIRLVNETIDTFIERTDIQLDLQDLDRLAEQINKDIKRI